jgi:multiple sugar transport system substrate-binding protein
MTPSDLHISTTHLKGKKLMKHSTQLGAKMRRAATVVAFGALAAAGLTACSPSTGGDASSIEEALDAGGSITVWNWGSQIKDQAAAFEAEYPNVKVDVQNVGVGTDHYVKLQNAVKAGSGAPDVALLEPYALPQFIASKSLVDLSAYGFADQKGLFRDGEWSLVDTDGGLWAMPVDSAPMVLYYNKTVFDQFGLTVPTTWSEYVDDARIMHEADPSVFIGSTYSGDPSWTQSMIWQAGGQPFKSTGTDITLDLQDAGSTTWANTWNELVSAGVLSSKMPWEPEGLTLLANDKIATLPSAAWMAANIESQVPTGSGKWRVAQMPTYDGTPATAQYGGGTLAVMQQSKNQALAAAFVNWIATSDESTKIWADSGAFSPISKISDSDAYLSATSDYFGGQSINTEFSKAAKTVRTGWQYLPVGVYANSVFGDYVGKAYGDGSDLNAGLSSWQDAIVKFGREQGFTVNGK